MMVAPVTIRLSVRAEVVVGVLVLVLWESNLDIFVVGGGGDERYCIDWQAPFARRNWCVLRLHNNLTTFNPNKVRSVAQSRCVFGGSRTPNSFMF